MFSITFMYPIKAIHTDLLKSKLNFLYLSPVIVMFFTYIVYHLVMDLPMNKIYNTYEELLLPENKVTTIMRALLVVSFMFYFGYLMYNLYRLIPIYQKSIEERYADDNHNIRWIRTFIICMVGICIGYIINLAHLNPYTYTLYIVLSSLSFLYLIDNAFQHKPLESPKKFHVQWNFKEGWHSVDSSNPMPDKSGKLNEEIFTELNEWLDNNKPYYNTTFSSKNIEEVFPSLDYIRLNEILEEKGYSLQTYIREKRVNDAIEIARNEKISYKEIAFRVGFSHYSSFSRAFTAVTGSSPRNHN